MASNVTVAASVTTRFSARASLTNDPVSGLARTAPNAKRDFGAPTVKTNVPERRAIHAVSTATAVKDPPARAFARAMPVRRGGTGRTQCATGASPGGSGKIVASSAPWVTAAQESARAAAFATMALKAAASVRALDGTAASTADDASSAGGAQAAAPLVQTWVALCARTAAAAPTQRPATDLASVARATSGHRANTAVPTQPAVHATTKVPAFWPRTACLADARIARPTPTAGIGEAMPASSVNLAISVGPVAPNAPAGTLRLAPGEACATKAKPARAAANAPVVTQDRLVEKPAQAVSSLPAISAAIAIRTLPHATVSTTM